MTHQENPHMAVLSAVAPMTSISLGTHIPSEDDNMTVLFLSDPHFNPSPGDIGALRMACKEGSADVVAIGISTGGEEMGGGEIGDSTGGGLASPRRQ